MRTFGEAPPPPTFFDKLKSGLAKTGLGEILTKKKLDAAAIAELEEALIRADMGGPQARKIAAAVAKPLVLWVISAETVPTAPAVVSLTELMVSELVPGAGLW